MSACSVKRENPSDVKACNLLEPCSIENDGNGFLENTGKIQEISLEELYDRINSRGTSMIFIGRDSCKWCNKVKSIITNNYIQSITYYFNIDLVPEEKRDEFIYRIQELVNLDSEEIGVPLLIKVCDGICLEILNGLPEYSVASEEIEKIWLNNIIVTFLGERSS